MDQLNIVSYPLILHKYCVRENGGCGVGTWAKRNYRMGGGGGELGKTGEVVRGTREEGGLLSAPSFK